MAVGNWSGRSFVSALAWSAVGQWPTAFCRRTHLGVAGNDGGRIGFRRPRGTSGSAAGLERGWSVTVDPTGIGGALREYRNL